MPKILLHHLRRRELLSPLHQRDHSDRQLPAEGICFQIWPAAASLVALLDRRAARADIPALTSLLSAGNSRLRLLDLGTGTGLVGIAAAALLGASVTVTDLTRVLSNLRFNADANAAAVAALSWGDAAEMEGVGGDFDVVLGSDLVPWPPLRAAAVDPEVPAFR